MATGRVHYELYSGDVLRFAGTQHVSLSARALKEHVSVKGEERIGPVTYSNVGLIYFGDMFMLVKRDPFLEETWLVFNARLGFGIIADSFVYESMQLIARAA